MATANVTGIDVPNVTEWLTALVDVSGDLHFDPVAHGRSNLTFVVHDDAGQKWVLRRPPTGHVLASAHDMGREHKIIAALQESAVPVPGVVGMCDDDAVNGAPFYVMQFVDGYIINTLELAQPHSLEQRRTQSEALVDILAALHRVDPNQVGLGDLGRKEAYLARQLRRWKRQIDEGSDRPLPLFHEVHTVLDSRMPEQQGSGIAHGDYRLDNCMVGRDHHIAAVLDWELCTLGDVLADLGGMLMWWGDPDSAHSTMRDVPTLAPGYLTPDEVVARYAANSDRNLSDLPYYVAFQFWRLAAISEGVRVRFVGGAMGDKDIGEEMAGFETRIDALLEASRAALADL
jgi:aminoglycoside phosphotransferase (APT) family kinase protein